MSEPNATADATQTEYSSIAAYMQMRDGAAAPDDVTLASSADPAQAVADPPTVDTPEAPAGETSAPTPAEVSDAARTLSQHANETRAQKRTREIQEQIGRETARKHTAKAEADQEEVRRDAIRAEIAALSTQRQAGSGNAPAPGPAPVATPVAVAAARPVPPKFEDVGTEAMPTWDDYQKANQKFVSDIADWSTGEAVRLAKQTVGETMAATQKQAAVATAEQTYVSRVEAFRATHADYNTVVFQNQALLALPLTDVFVDELKTDPKGPDVAYYLGTHLEEAARISRLSPLAQVKELGRLSTQFAPTPVPVTPVAADKKPTSPTPTAPVSRTPPPVPLAGGSSTSSQVPLEQRSAAEYLRERNRRIDEKRGL